MDNEAYMSLFTSPKLGIDLGTTNILVFAPGRGVVVNEPSVVAIAMPEKQVVAIGSDAKDMIGKTPDSIIAYRPMRDGVIADFHVIETMLKYFIQRAMGQWNIWKPDLVVSVPAGITSAERRAVVEAGMRAGASSVIPAREPILAAVGAGIPIYEASGHMVVDIGGGTTDVAVITLGSIDAAASVKCAGTKIDHAIIDYIKRTHNLSIGELTAEKIKIKIGSAIRVENELEIMIKGRDIMTGLPRSVRMTTNEVVVAIERELNTMIQAIKDVLHQTKPELSADLIDNGIVLTGGSSLLRGLPDLILERTGIKAVVAEDALYCVAKGTGIVLEHLDTYKKALLSK
jgi:rod shape-determining protein MreB and related proteins